MSNTITGLANIIRGLAALAIVGLVASGGWVAYRAFDERARLDRDLEERTAEVAKLTTQNDKLKLALRLLKVDHRVAEITVLDQHQENQRPVTRVQFAEMTTGGDPIGDKKIFTVDGDTIYVDAWVIKYSDDLVESGDPLRSTSVCFFRRIFGEYQEPREGFALDAAGSRPAVYSQGNEMSPLEHDLWANFWEYANDPAKAKRAGMRAAHGEAPSIRLQMGKRYKVELRASGGLSIIPDDVPRQPAS